MLEKYNAVWTTPSEDSFDSMPLSGSCGAGANVWCQDGLLWIYVAHNGAYDKNMELLKIGCVQIEFCGLYISEGTNFRQELDLQKGEINIDWGDDSGSVKLKLYYIGENLVCEVLSDKAIALKISAASWRNAEIKQQVGFKKIKWNDFSLKIINQFRKIIGEVNVKRKKSVEYIECGDGILMIHKNGHCFAPVINNREFGMYVTAGKALLDITASKFNLQSWKGIAVNAMTQESIKQVVVIATNGKDCSQLKQSAENTFHNLESLKIAENARWSEFWDRSHIYINPERGRYKSILCKDGFFLAMPRCEYGMHGR